MSAGGRRLVVEADGGSRGNPGPAGYGALVRDAETGQVLAEHAAAIGTATNNVAEYSGLLAGLRAAAEIDPQAQVEVRMDSRLVVEQMSGRWQVKHEDMRRLVREARGVLPAGRVTYAWVPRARNEDADRLANEAMDAAAQGRPWQRRGGAGSASGSSSGSSAGSSAGSSEPSGGDAEGEDASGFEALAAQAVAAEVMPPRGLAPEPGQEPAEEPDARAPGAGERLRYRVLTGPDDRAFCERVSRALAEGYQLHGSPAVAFDGQRVVVAQALVLP
ncbi:DUF1737 domain-containing protein [Quadrisphaera sp. DSM 44207]|uniref:DUF1737 domain-containing protein n=1 Tax=Quadrisphaera sp. DSM 44207 TaxID=1881057 RepID=UPI0008804D68|nr:DUF1737 domain-containing protein [Quadrisphaera sp. DSM 44207]SDQ04209.1 Ribonuclease HI [Quadrisphaera sp. DSM 44207]